MNKETYKKMAKIGLLDELGNVMRDIENYIHYIRSHNINEIDPEDAVKIELKAIQLRILLENLIGVYSKPEWRDIIKDIVKDWAKKYDLQYWWIV